MAKNIVAITVVGAFLIFAVLLGEVTNDTRVGYGTGFMLMFIYYQFIGPRIYKERPQNRTKDMRLVRYTGD